MTGLLRCNGQEERAANAVTDSKKKGMSDITHGFTPSSSNERMNVGIRGTRKRTHEGSVQKKETIKIARGGYSKIAPQKQTNKQYSSI
jgi:hypothetical protein